MAAKGSAEKLPPELLFVTNFSDLQCLDVALSIVRQLQTTTVIRNVTFKS